MDTPEKIATAIGAVLLASLVWWFVVPVVQFILGLVF